MKKMIQNFLTSDHKFLENDNLQKFRFSLLNSLMLIAIKPESKVIYFTLKQTILEDIRSQ